MRTHCKEYYKMQYINSFRFASGDTDAFKFTIDTTLGDGLPSFTLPLRLGYNYNFTITWGDGDASTVTAYNDPAITHSYISGGTYQISIQGTCEAWYFNNGGDKDKLTSVDQLGDIGLVAIDGGFWGCSNMTTFAGDNPNWTSNCTNFSGAWRDCTSLTSFPLLDTSNGTSFQAAWRNCNSLTTFPLLNTSSGTNFVLAWFNCTSLTSFPLLDTSNGTSFYQTWYNCTSLTSFPELDTSSGTTFFWTWVNCNSLTSFPLLDTSNGTTFVLAWANCSSLTSFPELDVSSGTNFQQAWANCSSLTSFPELDTSSGTNFANAWKNCTSLTEITNFGSWAITGVTDMTDMLSGVTLNTSNYDATLIGWNSQRSDWSNLTDLEIDFGNSQYTSGGAAETARTSIISNGATNLQDGGGI